jgi:hypothetical protein
MKFKRFWRRHKILIVIAAIRFLALPALSLIPDFLPENEIFEAFFFESLSRERTYELFNELFALSFLVFVLERVYEGYNNLSELKHKITEMFAGGQSIDSKFAEELQSLLLKTGVYNGRLVELFDKFHNRINTGREDEYAALFKEIRIETLTRLASI